MTAGCHGEGFIQQKIHGGTQAGVIAGISVVTGSSKRSRACRAGVAQRSPRARLLLQTPCVCERRGGEDQAPATLVALQPGSSALARKWPEAGRAEPRCLRGHPCAGGQPRGCVWCQSRSLEGGHLICPLLFHTSCCAYFCPRMLGLVSCPSSAPSSVSFSVMVISCNLGQLLFLLDVPYS